MKRIYYFTASFFLWVSYKSTIIINSVFGTNIGGYGNFSNQNYYDIGGEYEHKLYKQREIVEIYRSYIKIYLSILDAVLLGVKEKQDFIIPEHWLNIFFVHIVSDLKSFQYGNVCNRDIYISHSSDDGESDKIIFLAQPWWKNLVSTFPTLLFDDFSNLTVNPERLIKEYPEKRKAILKYLETIDTIFLQICKTEGNLPIILENDLKEYHALINEHQKKRSRQIGKIQLVIDLTKATLRYKNYKSIDISLDTQPIKLLQLLLANISKVLEYTFIAGTLKLNSYFPGIDNKSIARDVNYVRRDLVELLIKAGMSKDEINKFISTQKNIGYKISPLT